MEPTKYEELQSKKEGNLFNPKYQDGQELEAIIEDSINEIEVVDSEDIGELQEAINEKGLGVRFLRKQYKTYAKKLKYHRYHKVPSIQ